ncbi:MAG: hypothetical protein ACLFTV_13665 [Desulfococcaceae bacterium]
MCRSIFYKEFIKLRWTWMILALLNAALMAYVFVEIRRLFTLDHPEVVWYRALHLGQVHFGAMKFAPTLTGIFLAFLQFLPEMREERLRLSLHLPVPPARMVLTHVLAGLAAGGVLILLDGLLLGLIFKMYYPWEGVVFALTTALPWFMAGFTAYLGITLGLLEPNLRRRVFNLLLAAGVTGLFLLQIAPGGYTPALGPLGFAAALMIPAVLVPAYHFRLRRAS